MIEDGDDTSYTDDGEYGTNTNTDQMSGKEKTYDDRKTDVTYIKTVLGKSDTLIDEVGDCLNDTVSRIRDDTHVKRKGSTDTG